MAGRCGPVASLGFGTCGGRHRAGPNQQAVGSFAGWQVADIQAAARASVKLWQSGDPNCLTVERVPAQASALCGAEIEEPREAERQGGLLGRSWGLSLLELGQ